MKKCPKCKANIQENARFCLYCMTSFEEKENINIPKKSSFLWPALVASFLAIALIFYATFLGFSKNQNGSSSSGILNNNSSQNSVSNNSKTTVLENITANLASNILVSNNSTTKKSTNKKTGAKNSSSKSSSKYNNSSSSNVAATSSNKVTTNVSYTYRNAKDGDDFSVITNLSNCVVITGVKNATSNGEYHIPSTIDGKKVVAIMPLAFCGENIKNTVKKVVVPSTVLTIWNNAFANCYNLSDIYFCGNAIYTEKKAFADPDKRNCTLKIHCSSSCSDRCYRYYKNSSDSYNAVYVEWEG